MYGIIYRDSWTEKTKSGANKKRLTTFRGFLGVTLDHDNETFVTTERARLESQWASDDVLPTEEVPVGNDQRPHTYGMEKWVKMFNSRQQLTHGHCVEAFRECVDEDQTSERLEECRKAAWCYIALAIDKMLHRNCLLARWDPGKNIVASAFDTHDFGFKWSYAEMAITCQGLGLEWSLENVEDCLSDLLKMTGQGETPTQLIKQEGPKKKPNSLTGNQR